MSSDEDLLHKHRGKRILFDSNLLLLYLIGTFQRTLIPKFKRTASFLESDFDSLLILSTQFRSILTTPHLLTEVNGLANSLPEYLRFDFAEHFAEMVGRFIEITTSATDLVNEPLFLRFGLADAALHNASQQALILTDDFRLAGYLRKLDRDVLNFREIAY